MSDVSIIIINYNTFELTCTCIRSIVDFTKGVSYEIILVDNASVDKMPEDFTAVFPNIILIKNRENVGFSKANNIGIRRASGDVILLLNSDTELKDDSISLAYQNLVERNALKTVVVTGKLIYPDGRTQYQCGRFPSISLQLIELFRLQKLLSKEQRGSLLLGGFFNHERPVSPDWIWGTFFMFKKNILDYFPDKKLTETYFMYQEDLEWCFYVKKAGFKIYYDPAIKVIHHFSSSSRTQELVTRKDLLLENNYRDFLKRHYGIAYTGVFLALLKINKKIHAMLG